MQNHLTDSLTQIDCYADDLIQVISLDEERITSRGGEAPDCNSCTPAPGSFPSSNQASPSETRSPSDDRLTAIKEEDEDEDDYPLDQ